MVMTVDAVNSYGVKVYIHYDAAATDLHNLFQDTTSALKRIENGQVIIIRNNSKYSLLGTRIE